MKDSRALLSFNEFSGVKNFLESIRPKIDKNCKKIFSMFLFFTDEIFTEVQGEAVRETTFFGKGASRWYNEIFKKKFFGVYDGLFLRGNNFVQKLGQRMNGSGLISW